MATPAWPTSIRRRNGWRTRSIRNDRAVESPCVCRAKRYRPARIQPVSPGGVMPPRMLRTSRLLSRFLLALPLGVGAGCYTAGSATPEKPPANPSLYREQKPEDVRPLSASSLPPTTFADGTIAPRAVAYVNNSPIFESELRDAVMQHVHELAKLGETERSEKLKALRKEELERLIEREAIMEEATTRIKKIRPKVLKDLQHEPTPHFEK